MANDKSKRLTKKQANSVWWFIFILVVISIIMKCILAFELAVFLGICVIFAGPYMKSADTNGKKEAAEEHERYIAEVEEIVEEKEPDFVAGSEKTDSFYSGISKGSSIDGGGTKNDA